MNGRDAPVVLHVLESYGAGSARAAEGYAAATPEYRHIVLRRRRANEFVEGQEARAFAEVHDLPDGALAAIRAIRRVIRATQPDRVHAHSSFAGAFVRLAIPLRAARRRVVYTPHCFAFERLDLAVPLRLAFWVAELLLSTRTRRIAACSDRERRLAARMLAAHPPLTVPNVASPAFRPSARPPEPGGALVSIGRIGPQKDPALFATIAARVLPQGDADGARWIGGGDPALSAALAAAGVQVTGWLPEDRIADECGLAAVYLHTARWEGFPLAVLEAAATGLPVVARRIPALFGAPDAWLFTDATEASAKVAALRGHSARAENLRAWRSFLQGNTVERQRARLREVYALPVR